MKFIKFLLNIFFCCLFKLYISLRTSKNLKSTSISRNHTDNISLDEKHKQISSLVEKIKFSQNKTHESAYLFYDKNLNSSLKNLTHNIDDHKKINPSSHPENNINHTIKNINKTSSISQIIKDHNKKNKSNNETFKNNSKAIKGHQESHKNIKPLNNTESIKVNHSNLNNNSKAIKGHQESHKNTKPLNKTESIKANHSNSKANSKPINDNQKSHKNKTLNL